MRKSLLTFALICVVCGVYSQTENTLGYYQLKGPVKAVAIERYLVDTLSGTPRPGARFISKYMYADFNLTFNIDGKLVEQKILQNEIEKRQHIYSYDDSGKLIKVKGSGSGYFDHSYMYDGKRLIEHRSERVNRNPTYNHYKYDESGNKTERYTLNWSKDTTDAYYYTFNKKNEIISEKRFRDGKPYLHQYEWEYDDKGRKIMETDSFGVPYSKKLVYNDYGDLIREEITNAIGVDIKEYRFKYDEKNNWIEEIVINKGRLIYIRKRTIAYF